MLVTVNAPVRLAVTPPAKVTVRSRAPIVAALLIVTDIEILFPVAELIVPVTPVPLKVTPVAPFKLVPVTTALTLDP